MMTDIKSKNKYAVVDLEATSASSEGRIIQVGIVLVENGEITKTYTTDVNPHQSLTKHIIDLTGITDEQLQTAPEFSQVAGEIYELIKDCIFVAHNVKFDANLLAEELFLEGYELRTPRVDTVELAQVFYPTLERYRLSDLAYHLELDLEHAHTAVADAYATAQLLIKLQEKIASLPRLTVEQILTYADQLVYESRLVIDDIYAQMPAQLSDDYVEVDNIVVKKEAPLQKPRRLSEDFTTNLALLELDERPKQEAFAREISQHFDQQKSPLFIQAQAGLGKTYGYLLALLAKAPKQKIILSVPTKVLQDQIMTQEGARISEVFHINFHSLKSPKNYIKLDNFSESLKEEDGNRLVNRYKMQLLVWLTQTQTGDLDEIKQKQRFEGYFDKIRHDGNLSQHSNFLALDFWNRSYERAKASQVIITNHAYFLTRIEDDKDFVRDTILVVDEAQKLFLSLEQFSRRQVNLNHMMKCLHELSEHPISHVQKRIIESLQYELSRLLTTFHQEGQERLSDEQIAKIRQDLSELDSSELYDLELAFSPAYADFWLSQETFQEQRVTYLNSARADFINFKDFLPRTFKTYFVSATLTISPNVTLPDLLGFEQADFVLLPQEQQKGQTIWLDQTMPVVSDLSQQDYARKITERIRELTNLKRSILVLFTSKKTLFEVSDELENSQISHLCQYKNGPATNVKRRFDKGESQILLGTGSFWEGVDFANHSQLIEVITRLPFDNPEDSFIKKLNRQLRQAGKNPFYDYTLPVTILRLKQAIGRSKRHPNQKSAVLILDKRILTKRYGHFIEEALRESHPFEVESFEGILSEMAQFFGNI